MHQTSARRDITWDRGFPDIPSDIPSDILTFLDFIRFRATPHNFQMSVLRK